MGLIEGSTNNYITREGQVYRLLKTGEYKLLGHQNGQGYVEANLKLYGKYCNKRVHRLVAEAFIPNPNNLPVVDHIDEDKTNNHASNLRWCTQAENTKFYNEKNGRSHWQKQLQKKEATIKALQQELVSERKVHIQELKKLENIIDSKQKICDSLDNKIALQVRQLESASAKVDHAKAQTPGAKFSSIDEMVATTGIPVKVNGEVFPSAGAAATHILATFPEKNKSTVSKTIRKMTSGKMPYGTMYKTFAIEEA